MLSLCQEFEEVRYEVQHPEFHLAVSDGLDGGGIPHALEDFNHETQVFVTCEMGEPFEEASAHHLQIAVTIELNANDAYVTQELHPGQPREKVLFEVYCGKARTSQVAESLGMEIHGLQPKGPQRSVHEGGPCGDA